MCRGEKYCTELGNNPSEWDSDCPLRLPAVYNSAVDTFADAVRLFAGGQRDQCICLLEAIDSASITNWYIEHGQQSGLHRSRVIGLMLDAPLPVESRYHVRSPAKLQSAVFERDGYRCRYCGNKLIDQNVLKNFAKALDSPIFNRGTTNLTSHAIIHIAWPVADHVVPWSRGGETSMNNLVASCAPCNYGKGDFTIEQIGISSPLDRPPVVGEWDGLRSLAEAV